MYMLCICPEIYIYIYIYNIDFVYVNVFNLLIKFYLFLIFIKYLINEFRKNIKFSGQKYFANKITILL
jgi:hypothetical protein